MIELTIDQEALKSLCSLAFVLALFWIGVRLLGDR